jgi:NADPH:quinone reductase-like Zn-dependent oxidoreductase
LTQVSKPPNVAMALSAMARTSSRRPTSAEPDMTHKPLREQVIVITGASSGIGLATARMAAER